MNKIWKMTLCEIKKALSKKVVVAFIVISVLIVCIYALRIKNSTEGFSEYEMEDWKIYLQIEIDSNNALIADDTIGYSSQSMILEMINQNKVYQYQIDNNIPPILQRSASNLLLKSNDLFVFISFCVIMLSCYLISCEYSDGTMHRLILMGVKRWKILSAKYLSILILTCMFMVLFVVCTIVCGWLLFGFDDFSGQYVYYNGENVVGVNVIIQVLQCFAYNSLALITVSALAVLIAIITKSNILGLAVSFVILSFGTVICEIFSDVDEMKYTLFANMNFSKYLNSSITYNDISPAFSIVILILHCVIFIIPTYAIFSKRDIEC